MTQIQDGFMLAEKDLLLRGPGQFFGNKQHGIPDLKIADIINDIDILNHARQAARQTLRNPAYMARIMAYLNQKYSNQFKWLFQS